MRNKENKNNKIFKRIKKAIKEFQDYDPRRKPAPKEPKPVVRPPSIYKTHDHLRGGYQPLHDTCNQPPKGGTNIKEPKAGAIWKNDKAKFLHNMIEANENLEITLIDSYNNYGHEGINITRLLEDTHKVIRAQNDFIDYLLGEEKRER